MLRVSMYTDLIKSRECFDIIFKFFLLQVGFEPSPAPKVGVLDLFNEIPVLQESWQRSHMERGCSLAKQCAAPNSLELFDDCCMLKIFALKVLPNHMFNLQTRALNGGKFGFADYRKLLRPLLQTKTNQRKIYSLNDYFSCSYALRYFKSFHLLT